jgi:serine/threonine protein kinase
VGSRPGVNQADESSRTDASEGEGSRAITPGRSAGGEAPRPSWVHESPTPESLLRHAEQAVGDRYRIETIAGEGGMGRVFSARETAKGRKVAIKLLSVLDPNPGEDPGLRAHDRLVGEARAMARLNHPNLCRVLEVSLVGQTPFLVMEWAEGQNLARFCAGLDVRRRISVLLQVLDAAGAMHAEGLVHGDLKPANVLIDRDGKATVVDFGLTRAESDPSWVVVPRGGTPGYAAPEQLTGGAVIGPPADVFALGVMLFELLTGRSPFPRGTSPAIMIDMLRRGAIPLPERYAPETPADLQKICLVALEGDPADRYPDAGAMAADIRRYLRRETVSARPRILETRFAEQIETQIAQLREWRRLGMVTIRDTETVARVLADLQRSESPWLIDARRLRASQVALSLGGWIFLLGLIVGLARAPHAISPAVSLTLAWLIALALGGLGFHLQRSGEKRVGVGMLVTALLAIPAAFGLTLRQTGWLAGAGGGGELLESLFAVSSPPPGLGDAQILAIAALALALAAGLRRLVRSTVFTLFAVLCGGLAWLALFPVLGGMNGAPAMGRWGLWLALLGAATLPVGLLIDTREHELVRELGRRRATRRDAAPVLCGSLAWMGLGVSAAAWSAPSWYTLGSGGGGEPGTRAWAFAVNALLLVGVMLLLGRRSTTLRRRLVGALRWIIPAHLMLPLLFMEIHESWGVWTPWAVLLPVVALGFCFASALRQWKPFLISGMAFLAIWYARCFTRIEGELAVDGAFRAGLTLAALALGPGLMFLAWRAPAWVARHRLRKWERLSVRPPGARAGRSWR